MPEKEKISIVLASENDSLAEKIRKSGIALVQTRDGFETIKKAVESKPHAVLLDTLAAGLPSATVAVWLKLNSATNKLPIIGLSDGSQNWQEAKVDAEIGQDEAVDELAALVNYLIDTTGTDPGSDPSTVQDTEPLDITLDLIEIYRERLLLANAMIELAGLQHDLGDSEYTIKSVLEVAGRALGSELISITLIRERTHYTLVRGKNFSRNHLDKLDTFGDRELTALFSKPIEIDNQLVIGRRKLSDPSDNDIEVSFIGHPVWSRGEILGYLSCVTPMDISQKPYLQGLLPDLTSQIALLLVNADLINTQENYVHELSSILRAAVETSSISTISEESAKGFLLQFLLIILDLCRSDRGCVVLFDSETSHISENAALGVETDEVLANNVKNNKILSEELINFPSGEVYTDEIKLDGQKMTRVIAPLSAGEENVGGLVVFGKTQNITSRVEEGIKALSSLAGYLAKNRSLHDKMVEKLIMEDQLNTAREVQLEMLPDCDPEFEGFDIHGKSKAAKEVGGDFFDYFPGEDTLNVAIGDVCGKSIPASLLMTMTRALYLAAIDSSEGPDEVLQKVNSLLTRTITQGKFVTGALLCINSEGIRYSSAGHQPLLIYRSNIDEFEEIDAEGIALGIIEFMDFENVSLKMESGDIALLYTDGLNEAMNTDREQFGYDNMKRVIRENAKSGSEHITDALLSAITEHADGADQHDDTTVIVVKKI